MPQLDISILTTQLLAVLYFFFSYLICISILFPIILIILKNFSYIELFKIDSFELAELSLCISYIAFTINSFFLYSIYRSVLFFKLYRS